MIIILTFYLSRVFSLLNPELSLNTNHNNDYHTLRNNKIPSLLVQLDFPFLLISHTLLAAPPTHYCEEAWAGQTYKSGCGYDVILQ